jgi:hypothetical protein
MVLRGWTPITKDVCHTWRRRRLARFAPPSISGDLEIPVAVSGDLYEEFYRDVTSYLPESKLPAVEYLATKASVPP